MRILMTSIILASTIAATATQAFEPGTYRSGQIYQSIKGQNAQACALQCAGDAQCKSWNFVQVRHTQNVGICEFMATNSVPVPSSISISGESRSARQSANLIPAGSRTTRIGLSQPVNMTASNTVHPIQPRQTMSQTVRKPVKLRHNLDATPQLPQAIKPPSTVPHIPPPRQNQDQPKTSLPAGEETNIPASPSSRSKLKPQLDTLAPPHAALETPSSAPNSDLDIPHHGKAEDGHMASAPPPISQQKRNTPQAEPWWSNSQYAPRRTFQPPQTARPLNPGGSIPVLPAEKAQQSLFGSLYDDVSIPRNLKTEDMTNPDAPIATVKSVPTQSIESASLY